jgi:uncharacterized membrane protein
MHSAQTDSPDAAVPSPQHGKGVAMVVYILFLGSIIMLPTAPVGVLIAHLKRRKVGAMADSHLLFQIRTFWLGLLALTVGVLLAWSLAGYVLIAAWLAWAVGRCGVGIHLLLENRAIEDPRSLWFGGTPITLRD